MLVLLLETIGDFIQKSTWASANVASSCNHRPTQVNTAADSVEEEDDVPEVM
jgi:hypothetical protein